MKTLKRMIIALLLFALAAAAAEFHAVFASGRTMVYMYHSVSDVPFNPDAEEFSVLESDFEAQLRYFSESGAETLFVTDLTKPEPEEGPRRVAITFDDGYEDNYTKAFPLLKKYGIKATVFMIAGKIDRPGYLTSAQIREMTESGLVSVQSHTVSHEPMAWGDKTYEDAVYEMGESKRLVEVASGAEVTALAMPNGSVDATLLDIADDYYTAVCTDADYRGFINGSASNPMDIHRVGIYRRHSVRDVRRMTEHRALYVLKRGAEKLLGLD